MFIKMILLIDGFTLGFGAGVAVAAFEKAFKDFNDLPM